MMAKMSRCFVFCLPFKALESISEDSKKEFRTGASSGHMEEIEGAKKEGCDKKDDASNRA